MGRPKKTVNEETTNFSVQLTKRQAAKLKALGGATWLRQKIDGAGTEEIKERIRRETEEFEQLMKEN